MKEKMNRLSHAKSPYLKSAANQPVAWYEWAQETFEEAQKQDKPILLDIGAVWCHWCHVIDRESYENPDIASMINQHFIAVKVDRDERPDIDSRYQQAVSALTGMGGWPLTAFLTPAGDVFYGGTYFPPRDWQGRAGFPTVLERIAQVWRERKQAILEDAQKLKAALGDFHGFKPSDAGPDILDSVTESLKNSFDAAYGGFGSAPKFPHPTSLDFLIHRWFQTKDEHLKTIIETTLTAMGKGGVYDQIGGGFHRYSTDEHWIVPHFEKMIYDNSELLKAYTHAYQAFGNSYFKEKALDIIRWVNDVLSDPNRGGFYASQDADIDLDDDGNYFTWTKPEAEAVLSKEEAEVILPYYDIEEQGEMHHEPDRNVLYVAAELEMLAEKLSIPPEEIHRRLVSGKAKMFEARRKRRTPYVDRSLYANWNAMMITAFLEAYEAFGIEKEKTFALKTLDRFMREGRNSNGGVAHDLGGTSKLQYFLDDQSQMLVATLKAYEVSAATRYLDFAKALADFLIAHFADEGGGFFDLPANGETGYLSIRQKSIQDSPTPSANASAILGLLKLHALTHEKSYRETAEKALRSFAAPARAFGYFASNYALALDFYLSGEIKIVIVGTPSDKRFQTLHAAALGTFRPNKVVEILDVTKLEALKKTVIASLTLFARNDEPCAYVCAGTTCRPPTNDPEELKRLIQNA